MIEDVHEPVELFRTVFKEAHARHTAEYFEDLLRRSGVDEHANVETVRALRVLEQHVANANFSNRWWRAARVAAYVIGALCLLLGYTQGTFWWLVGAAGAVALVFLKLNPLINDVTARLDRLGNQRDTKLQEAWQQLAPLNRLYDWDILAKLVQKTVPRVALDPYFSNGRLDELRNAFGWNDQFNQGRSVVFSHSGVLNGNPFVVARTLDHWMGTKTYHGSLQISWTEQVRGTDGRWSTVTHHQTLNASVNKPYPEYSDRAAVIYGSEAAPDLSFTRAPSKLSGLEDGVINNWRKRRAVKELEAKSRDLKHGKGFTVMANTEFDALFGATDRDHEVQFRLLFTPLAQQEMLKLLKDSEVGFGDDFRFTKQHRVNVVEPAQMAGIDISSDPANFHSFEIAQARKVFNDYHNRLFKSLFFGLAPLLAIPLYQQHRSHADIYKDLASRRSSFWEHEAIANYFGAQRFQHPDCVTHSILKTTAMAEADGTQTVRVTAYGYRGVARVDYVSVHGGDNRSHDVPVHWVEYIGVERESGFVVHEVAPEEGDAGEAAWVAAFQGRGVEPRQAVLRRSIASAVLVG